MDILIILITGIITSALWVIFIKFSQKDNSAEVEALRTKDEELKEKDHEIEKIKISHTNEIKLLNEKYISVEKIKNNLQDTLTTEKRKLKNHFVDIKK